MSSRPSRGITQSSSRLARLAVTSVILLAGTTLAAPQASAVESLAEVDAAVISVGKPTISGNAVVDGLLIAHPGPVTPSGTTLAYSWKAGTTVVAATNYYQPQPADVGKTITVTVTASKDGLLPVSSTSDPTPAVVKATFASNYTFAISGAPNVGSTVAVDYTSGAGVVSPKPSGASWQWLRDGAPIGSATNDAYQLTSADLGTSITLAAIVTRDGYNDLTITSSNAVGPVAPAAISLGKPTISGDAVVDGVLQANPGSVSPSGTSLAYSWKAGTTVVATTNYYQPKPADVGKTITVTVTASKSGLASVTKTSNPTAAVVKATFASTYTFAISGTPTVGKTLAFDLASVTGTVSPKPTGTTVRWLRNGASISGATGNTYKLTSADRGKTITLRVTVTKSGYDNLAITSRNAKGPIQ